MKPFFVVVGAAIAATESSVVVQLIWFYWRGKCYRWSW